MLRPTFADPKIDFLFARIFGSEERKEVLVTFLNNMLDLEEAHRITSVELIPVKQRRTVVELKYSILDAKCTDACGVTYVVKMQVLQVEGFEKQVVYNVAETCVNQSAQSGAGVRRTDVARGDLYPGLNDIVGVTICDFDLWPDTPTRKIPMLSRWYVTEEQTGAKDLGQMRFVFLELPKFDTTRPPQTMVEKWAYFFREADNLTVVPEALSEPPFVEAFEAARTAGFTAAEWDAYILAGIAIQNERGALSVAEKRGKAEGKAEGLRLGVEALCSALGIALTEARQKELAELDATGLGSLLARLQETKNWA